ncbi:MAG: hypothetical protein IFNCLDLE_00173 [Ignavibacteriaceae bacterium]|nr:hypothetical protein [Ignavibacteriaceae bacterium]
MTKMEELKEFRLNDNRILLNNNRVKSSILPKVTSEIHRDVIVQGNTIVEGAIFAQNLQVQNGPLEVQGAVFTNLELFINTEAQGDITFRKAVGSADSVVSYSPNSRVIFQSDINAKKIKLRNAFVAGNLFADTIELEDCIVIGGAFATDNLDVTNCILGTFNSSSLRVAKTLYLLLPSAFSVEPSVIIPGTEIFNLALADLGALYKGEAETETSGKIPMDFKNEEMKSVLASEDDNRVVRSYSVVGKVLAADLLDTDKLNNHFLITAAGLGNQLLKTYDLGMDSNNNPIVLTIEKIADFFFNIINGKISVKTIEGNFSISDLVKNFV